MLLAVDLSTSSAESPASESQCGNVTVVIPPGQYMDCVPDGRGPDGKPKFKAVVYSPPASLTSKVARDKWVIGELMKAHRLTTEPKPEVTAKILKGETVTFEDGKVLKLHSPQGSR